MAASLRPADEERHTRCGHRLDDSVGHREELIVDVDRLAVEHASDDVETAVGAPAAGGGVDADDFDLVSVLATDSHADGDSAGCGLRE